MREEAGVLGVAAEVAYDNHIHHNDVPVLASKAIWTLK